MVGIRAVEGPLRLETMRRESDGAAVDFAVAAHHPPRYPTPPLHQVERGPGGEVRHPYTHSPPNLPAGGGVILPRELRHSQRETLPVVPVLVAAPTGVDFVPAHAVEVRQQAARNH